MNDDECYESYNEILRNSQTQILTLVNSISVFGTELLLL